MELNTKNSNNEEDEGSTSEIERETKSEMREKGEIDSTNMKEVEYDIEWYEDEEDKEKARVELSNRAGEGVEEVEERFDVNCEKTPLHCFFCGKIGHGMKECEECKDDDGPMHNYGAWIKASPWKFLNGETSNPMRALSLLVQRNISDNLNKIWEER
ncbi:Gag polyprotein [Bienertia sinuspersici]